MAEVVEKDWEERPVPSIFNRATLSHVVCAVILFAACFPIEFQVKPYCSDWNPLDPATAKPIVDKGVPTWGTVIFVILYPLGVFTIVLFVDHFYRKRPWKEALYVNHLAHLSLAMAMSINILLTGAIKKYAGVKRPNFLQEALQRGFTLPQLVANPKIVCVNADRGFQQTMSCYPSGHASHTLCAATVVMCYLLVTTHSFRWATWHSMWVNLFFGFFPMIGCVLIGISRIRNYTHYPSDITAGCLLGITCGLMGVAMNFLPYYAEQAELRKRRKMRHTINFFTPPGYFVQTPRFVLSEGYQAVHGVCPTPTSLF